ncbi:FBXO47 ARM repeats region domain-containing protein [Caenorhabditis elegans]|uniref:F-box domain-containing protein n=2 Tax=Caenorhabditis elegans TaxID=6239 RepID=G5EDC7_CAEEL|nr:F-box domain-containing protein [Caenorhabditis elegans]CAB04206.2 F-box domain-containing protein [Caenorhabditis elegans]|eukprot:NP_492477.2 PRogression Of Meiosis [Caenorhabditis elegans]
MDKSTPRRTYNLRSADRTTQNSPVSRQSLENHRNASVSLRKRNSATEERCSRKRRRTQQTHGLPFSSPDAINHQRAFHLDEHKVCSKLTTRLSIEVETSYGSFGKLPYDAVIHILTRTPYNLLSRMVMTSSCWNQTIGAYMRSGAFRRRWLLDIDIAPSSKPLDPFFDMGKLVRCLTINYEWKARLDCLKSFMTLAYESGALIAGLGKMIHAFTNRPDEDIVLEQIDDIVAMLLALVSGLKDDLSAVLFTPETDRELEELDNMPILREEMKLRKKTLNLFLNNGSSDPAHGVNKYFLSSLMKVFKTAHNALPTALFYLLFSPTTIQDDEEVIHWHRLSLLSVVTSEEAEELKPLSRAMCALIQCRNLKHVLPWSKNTIFNLMEEITTYPNPWSMSTFVALNVLEPELVPIGVVARMNRNHEDEAGDIICTMKMLLHRWDMDVYGVMESIIDTIKAVLKPYQRRILFDRCWDWHQRNIDEHRNQMGHFSDIRAEIESQIEVMPVLMKLL